MMLSELREALSRLRVSTKSGGYVTTANWRVHAISLNRADDTWFIVIKVRPATPKQDVSPLTDCALSLKTNEGQEVGRARFDARGDARFNGLAAGEYGVHVLPEGEARAVPTVDMHELARRLDSLVDDGSDASLPGLWGAPLPPSEDDDAPRLAAAPTLILARTGEWLLQGPVVRPLEENDLALGLSWPGGHFARPETIAAIAFGARPSSVGAARQQIVAWEPEIPRDLTRLRVEVSSHPNRTLDKEELVFRVRRLDEQEAVVTVGLGARSDRVDVMETLGPNSEKTLVKTADRQGDAATYLHVWVKANPSAEWLKHVDPLTFRLDGGNTGA